MDVGFHVVRLNHEQVNMDKTNWKKKITDKLEIGRWWNSTNKYTLTSSVVIYWQIYKQTQEQMEPEQIQEIK